MDLYDMPSTITIGSDYLQAITDSDEPLAEIVTFLQEHAYSHLLDYADSLQFEGYEDDGAEPKLIVIESKTQGPVFTITANLEYNLVEQQNSCADSLASIKHSARLIYTYQMGTDEIEYEIDSQHFDDGYFPEEYGG